MDFIMIVGTVRLLNHHTNSFVHDCNQQNLLKGQFGYDYALKINFKQKARKTNVSMVSAQAQTKHLPYYTKNCKSEIMHFQSNCIEIFQLYNVFFGTPGKVHI